MTNRIVGSGTTGTGKCDIWMTIQVGEFPNKPVVSHQVCLSGEIITHERAALRYSIEKGINEILRLVDENGLKIFRPGGEQ